jgi:hypothetical protein
VDSSLCVVDLAGGIVEEDQQIVAAVVLEPGVRAAIEVQPHPRQRAAFPPPPMDSSFPAFLD